MSRTLLLFLFVTTILSCNPTPTSTDRFGTSTQPVTAQPDSSCTYKAFGGHDYWFCSRLSTWSSAKSSCTNVGLNLARIDAADENSFVGGSVIGDGWMGATDAGSPGTWSWTDNGAAFWPKSAAPSAFSHWEHGAPSSLPGLGCAAVERGGDWENHRCADVRPYVCENTPASASAPQAPDIPCTHTTRNGHEYWICTARQTVPDARKKCQSVGMDLAVVDDAGENSFITGAISQRSAIGLAESALPPPSDVWKWNANPQLGWCGKMDGAAPTGAYANWLLGEPNVDVLTLLSHGTRKPACAALDPVSGVWRAVSCETPTPYVCETTSLVGGPAFVAETTRVELARPGFTVQSLDVAPGVNPGNPFLRYARAFGLRDCIDTLSPPSSYQRSHNKPDEEIGEYGQLYNGVPVEGGGFAVSRARATGVIRSVSGGLIHGLTQSTTPVVTKSNAQKTAQSAADAPLLTLHPPTGTLEFARVRPRDVPSAFELAWLFQFPPDSTSKATAVVVSAVTGKVLRVVPRVQMGCTSFDTTGAAAPVPAPGLADTKTTNNYTGDVTISQYAASNAFGLVNTTTSPARRVLGPAVTTEGRYLRVKPLC